MLKKRIFIVIMALFSVAALSLVPSAQAINESIDITQTVGTNPADWTPQVKGEWNVDSDGDGVIEKANEVTTLVPLGGKMYAGGTFMEVHSANGNTAYPRGNIFAFNATTGAVDAQFTPSFNKPVTVIVPTQDGTSLYVGGEFTQLNGVKLPRPYLAKINAVTGALDTSFVPPTLNAKVNDLDIVHNQLIIAGKFTTANGTARTGLMSASLTTGAATSYMTPTLSVALNATSPLGIYRVAISPNGAKMAVAGSFQQVNGQPRLQMFIMNLTPTTSTLANWDSPLLRVASCSKKASGNAQVIGDMDFNASSSNLYVVSGGGNQPGICDAIVNFPVNATGLNVAETWVNRTHGDTLRSVEWTTGGIYVAGHQRWLSNVAGGTSANKVSRAGIGAVNQAGAALAWNPGKGREIGSTELIVTNSTQQPGQPTGLWVGSDSGACGVNVGEVRSHQGICFFPM